MDCERTRGLMALAIGGDVTPATRAEVERHAAACPACGAEWTRYGGASAALGSVRDVPEPPGGWGGLWAGIAEHLEAGPAPAAVPGAPGAGNVVSLSAAAARPRGGALRFVRIAAGLLIVGFTVGFTTYELGFRTEPSPAGPDPVASASPSSRLTGGGLPVTAGDRPIQVPPELSRVEPGRPSWQERFPARLELVPGVEKGWTVRSVAPRPEGPDPAQGLLPDDVLQAVNDAAVPRTPEEMDAFMSRMIGLPQLRLRVRRGEETRDIVLTPTK